MLPKKTRHALLVLWLGLAALAVHAFAGIAHVRAPAADGVLEICTARGVVRIDAQTLQPLADQPAAGADQQTPRCCELCGASCGAAVVAAASPAHPLGPAAAVAAAAAAAGPTGPAAEALTPLVPRGPPPRS